MRITTDLSDTWKKHRAYVEKRIQGHDIEYYKIIKAGDYFTLGDIVVSFRVSGANMGCMLIEGELTDMNFRDYWYILEERLELLDPENYPEYYI